MAPIQGSQFSKAFIAKFSPLGGKYDLHVNYDEFDRGILCLRVTVGHARLTYHARIGHEFGIDLHYMDNIETIYAPYLIGFLNGTSAEDFEEPQSDFVDRLIDKWDAAYEFVCLASSVQKSAFDSYSKSVREILYQKWAKK